MDKSLAIALAAFCLAVLRPPSAVAAEAVRVEVERDSATVYEPDFRPFTVTAAEMRLPDNDFEKFVAWMADRRDSRYALLFLRPDSALFQRRLRLLLRDSDVPVELEPLEADEPLPAAAPDHPAATGASRPVYFECRATGLFAISLEELKAAFGAKTQELLAETGGDEAEFFKKAAATGIALEGLRLDFGLAMTGRFLLFPVLEAGGHPADGDWFEGQLSAFDPSTHFVCFFVRPGGVRAFRQARAAAWARGFEVAVELMQERDPVSIGDPAGAPVRP